MKIISLNCDLNIIIDLFKIFKKRLRKCNRLKLRCFNRMSYYCYMINYVDCLGIYKN